jgi:hypothetical protein
MKIIVPFQTRLSLAWFQIRAPKTKKEYSVVTPVSGNPVHKAELVVILKIFVSTVSDPTNCLPLPLELVGQMPVHCLSQSSNMDLPQGVALLAHLSPRIPLIPKYADAHKNPTNYHLLPFGPVERIPAWRILLPRILISLCQVEPLNHPQTQRT